MNTIHRFPIRLKRSYKPLLVIMVVLALLWYLPGLLGGIPASRELHSVPPPPETR